MKKSNARRPVLAPQFSIGLDLGSATAVACLVDGAGNKLSTRDIELTVEHVRAEFGGEPVTVLMESSNVSGWVARLLEELGHEVVVCNPRRLKLISESTLKTDKLDAWVLARLARLHQLDPSIVQQSVVRTRDTQLKRSVMGVRDLLVRSRTSYIATVRNILRADACPRPKADAADFAHNVRKADLPGDVRAVILPLLVALDAINEQIVGLDKTILEISKTIPVIKEWTEINGVGPATALALALTIEDPSRFPHARDIGPFLGFTPSLRQSSESEVRGRCTKRGDARTRRYLVQAAMSLMRCKGDSELKQWALALAERRGKKKARVALARKLAVVMQRMWLTGESYAPFPSKKVSAAAKEAGIAA